VHGPGHDFEVSFDGDLSGILAESLDDLRHGYRAFEFMVPAVDPDPQHQTIISRFPRFIADCP
jgi:hypothetical protein